MGWQAPSTGRDLAIASCGNAALAAAVVAAAGERRLRVFVPVDADPGIVERLADLGADVVVCPRPPGVAGDPTYVRLRQEIDAGALPFTCQGNENGLAIEGGETIGYEMVSDLVGQRAPPRPSSWSRSGAERWRAVACRPSPRRCELGALARGPRAHTVQTLGAHPLERAHRRVARLLSGRDQPG